jgi:hypothetical protein
MTRNVFGWDLPPGVSHFSPDAPWNAPDTWCCDGCGKTFDYADEEPASERYDRSLGVDLFWCEACEKAD